MGMLRWKKWLEERTARRETQAEREQKHDELQDRPYGVVREDKIEALEAQSIDIDDLSDVSLHESILDPDGDFARRNDDVDDDHVYEYRFRTCQGPSSDAEENWEPRFTRPDAREHRYVPERTVAQAQD
ncbi:hypothetical protein Q5752_005253 [Cryptotrichosporon argae]